MNITMTVFRWFSKILHPCALDESSRSIGRVKLCLFQHIILVFLHVSKPAKHFVMSQFLYALNLW